MPDESRPGCNLQSDRVMLYSRSRVYAVLALTFATQAQVISKKVPPFSNNVSLFVKCIANGGKYVANDRKCFVNDERYRQGRTSVANEEKVSPMCLQLRKKCR